MSLTVKAKTTAEVVNNRPGAGILDNALAAEYKVQNTSPVTNILKNKSSSALYTVKLVKKVSKLAAKPKNTVVPYLLPWL